MTYEDFLASKFHFSRESGIEIGAEDLASVLLPHQRDIVRWAVRKGSAAIFAAFGLGKTLMQMEIQRHLHAAAGGRHLIIAPLGVRLEFLQSAGMLGMRYIFVRTTAEMTEPGFYLTNYESVRDGKLAVDGVASVSLDEASILRSYGSKTYQEFLTLFGAVPYKFVATATPSPNRHKELIHYAGFLGVMDTGQALTRFFQRDSTQANNLTLYPHMEQEFYLWLHSWAIFVQRPSDLGYSDAGYDLPPLNAHYHLVDATQLGGKIDRDGQVQLVNDAALSLKDAAEEKRTSIPQRVAKMLEIEQAIPLGEQLIVWCDLNDEQDAIEDVLAEHQVSFSSIHGSLTTEECERRLDEWLRGHTEVLIGKPVMLGSGLNLQQCHTAIFVGITYKFNDFIQAIYRIQRFQQQTQVDIHVIYTETEQQVLVSLRDKWSEDTKLRARMSELIQQYGLSTLALEADLRRSLGVERCEVRGEHFTAVHNDSIYEARRMAENTVDLIHTSIPFGNHYEYSPSYNDLGHNEDNAQFFQQMDYLTPELLRILRPGRIAAIHVKDRIRFGKVTGYGMPSVEPFHSDCIIHYRRHGFVYMGMITVVTDVVRENNQTYRLGWSEQCKDGSKMGVGSPEYILLFRKLPSDTSKAYADIRVEKTKQEYTRAQWQVDAHAFWRSSGDRLLTPDEFAALPMEQIGRAFEAQSLAGTYNYEQHVELGRQLDERGALPATFMSLAPGSHHDDVWHDVNRMLTLNGEQTQRGLTNHICPLQFDIVDRIIGRYTNPGELVFDPFAGLMTVPYRAMKLKRRGYGVELSAEYFRDGVRYLRAMEGQMSAPTLFDFERAV